ncbi:hypothetical protein B9G39_28470 [Zooshikella ganghwensis]|uniref:Uncharacterized protein n=1 Tax=Zooshikella ganghwensis TaxID=202772 RepID=A0A4P9VEA8_9GAMM|nr:hypothetical protein B9G39_28470 [Zooshikella ganghwensis]
MKPHRENNFKVISFKILIACFTSLVSVIFAKLFFSSDFKNESLMWFFFIMTVVWFILFSKFFKFWFESK